MSSRCFRCWSTRRSRSGCSTRSRACSSRAAARVITVRNKHSLFGWSLLPRADARAGAEPGAVRSARGAQRARDGGGAVQRSSARPASRSAPRATARSSTGALRYVVARLRAARVEDCAMTREQRAARRRPRPLFADRDAADALPGRAARALPYGSCRTSSTTSICRRAGPARSVAAHAASGRARLRRARLRQPRRPLAHVRRHGPLRHPLHLLAQSRGVRPLSADPGGAREAQMGRDGARPLQHALSLEHGGGCRARRDRGLRRVLSPPHRPPARRMVLARRDLHAEHARPRGRGRHQILLRLVSRRSAVPDPRRAAAA